MSWHKSTSPHVLTLNGVRKYLNTTERRRFLRCAGKAAPVVRLFCLTLMWSGSRISEALAVAPASIDLDACIVTLRTLKRRTPNVSRQVSLPKSLVQDLDRVFGLRGAQRDPARCQKRLWPWSGTTAWRHVKAVMKAAGVMGPAAMPKGLRHTFGVAAFRHSVPPHIVQRWLGHASLETTSIYAEVVGEEERDFATRIWRRS